MSKILPILILIGFLEFWPTDFSDDPQYDFDQSMIMLAGKVATSIKEKELKGVVNILPFTGPEGKEDERAQRIRNSLVVLGN